MRLIYLAPLNWSSFAQRPHMFVRWFHEQYQSSVLWVNPYPTRLPALSDFRRIAQAPDSCATEIPDWLQIITPKSLPIEPLPGSVFLNKLLWQAVLTQLQEFAAPEKTLIVIGKPSALALEAITILSNCDSLYDAMDDYPQFYRGLSRLTFAKREQQLVTAVKKVAVSSSTLFQKWSVVRSDVQLIRNGLMTDLFLPIVMPQPSKQMVFGYVGTLAQWFDWAWVTMLAEKFPDALVRLIGPQFGTLPLGLPANIECLPACDHNSAIAAMKNFTVGLIPFKQNALTRGVDPIKFYEYRALGIPVVATNFGEMQQHADLPGTFISHSLHDIEVVMRAALHFHDNEINRAAFIADHNWSKRFSALNI